MDSIKNQDLDGRSKNRLVEKSLLAIIVLGKIRSEW